MSDDQDDGVFELVRTVIAEEGSICEHTGDDGPTINVDVNDVADKIVRKLHEEGVFAHGGDWHMRQFGTYSLVSEVDAVRDAHVAHLEAALRTIATGGDAGGTFSGTQCAEIAQEALGLGDVERIPDGVKWPPRGKVAFTRYPVPGGDWHLIGPAVLLEPGAVVEVERFSERDSVLTAVGQVVAERTVIHKDVGSVRYVIARVSRAVRS